VLSLVLALCLVSTWQAGKSIPFIFGSVHSLRVLRCVHIAGMLQPSGGTAYVDVLDLRRDMGTIRHSLGMCPQFDILWPTITAREHLQLCVMGQRLA